MLLLHIHTFGKDFAMVDTRHVLNVYDKYKEAVVKIIKANKIFFVIVNSIPYEIHDYLTVYVTNCALLRYI